MLACAPACVGDTDSFDRGKCTVYQLSHYKVKSPPDADECQDKGDGRKDNNRHTLTIPIERRTAQSFIHLLFSVTDLVLLFVLQKEEMEVRDAAGWSPPSLPSSLVHFILPIGEGGRGSENNLNKQTSRSHVTACDLLEVLKKTEGEQA